MANDFRLPIEHFRRETTIVVGVDAKTFCQWRETIKSWVHFWPEFCTHHPWLVFYDWGNEGGPLSENVREVLCDNNVRTNVTTVAWPPNTIEYETQREKMLTGYVYCSSQARTGWWMKIDTDAYCTARDEKAFQREWFSPIFPHEKAPVYVANGWGYTKAKGGGGNAHDWAESLESWGDKAFGWSNRVGLSDHINERGNKIRMGRMASWISIYYRPWTRSCADLATRHGRGYRIPVPSQDTFHWYCAQRCAEPVVHTKFKQHGWTNKTGSPQRLRELVHEAIGSAT